MRGFLQTGLWTKGRLLSRRCLPKLGFVLSTAASNKAEVLLINCAEMQRVCIGFGGDLRCQWIWMRSLKPFGK